MARTFDTIIQKARRKFGKSDFELEQDIRCLVEDELREICSDFPYWFLAIEPGMMLPGLFDTFPDMGDVGTPLAGRWLDQGWLITEPEVGQYPLLCAIEEDPVLGPTNFTHCEAAALNYVKVFSHTGGFLNDYEVGDSNHFLSRGSINGDPAPSYNGIVWAHTINEQTYLRINPIPTDYQILAVSYQLAYPPSYPSGSDVSNLILRYYPNLIQYLVMMEYADWFNEPQRYAQFKMKLYGDTDRGVVRSDLLNCGLIGKMKMDTDRRYGQMSEESPFYESLTDSVGRNGYSTHRPGSGYYLGRPGY